MEEIFKPISYNPMYLVSNYGRIKSNYKSNKRSDDYLSPGTRGSGYKYVVLQNPEGKYMPSKSFYVHRLVMLEFGSNPDNLPEVNHIDGDKGNNCIDNLEWVSHMDNIKKSYDTGQRKVVTGSDHWLYGKKSSLKTRRKQSVAKIGENHPKFRGYYVVFGEKYASARLAGEAVGVSGKTVIRKCNNPDVEDYYFMEK